MDTQNTDRGYQDQANRTVVSSERREFNSYTNWLEKRILSKNKTSINVDKSPKRKRPEALATIKKKKKKMMSRNAYLDEIQLQISTLKNHNAQ
jgi:hypothetical protein